MTLASISTPRSVIRTPGQNPTMLKNWATNLVFRQQEDIWNLVSSPAHDTIMTLTGIPRDRIALAEGARFELAVHEVDAGFQDRWFQPLTHPSDNDDIESRRISAFNQTERFWSLEYRFGREDTRQGIRHGRFALRY